MLIDPHERVSARYLALGLVVSILIGQWLGALHFSTVSHQICGHGELVHDEASACHSEHSEDSSAFARRTRATRAAAATFEVRESETSASHDHCALVGLRQSPDLPRLAEVASRIVELDPAVVAAMSPQTRGSRTAIHKLFPKTSPPRSI